MNTTYAIASIRTRVFAIRRDLLQGYIVPTDQRFLPITDGLLRVLELADLLQEELVSRDYNGTGGNDIVVAQ